MLCTSLVVVVSTILYAVFNQKHIICNLSSAAEDRELSLSWNFKVYEDGLETLSFYFSLFSLLCLYTFET